MAKAKTIIEQEGASGAEFTYLVPGGNKIHPQIAVIVQQQLAAIGLKVAIIKIDPGRDWGAPLGPVREPARSRAGTGRLHRLERPDLQMR